jgi:hypothetical protein
MMEFMLGRLRLYYVHFNAKVQRMIPFSGPHRASVTLSHKGLYPRRQTPHHRIVLNLL